jgi:hypothetical protein
VRGARFEEDQSPLVRIWRARWWRAPYDVDDGFAALDLPMLSVAATRDSVRTFAADAPGRAAALADTDVDALVEAGAEATEPQVRAVTAGWDAAAGLAAARAFRPLASRP